MRFAIIIGLAAGIAVGCASKNKDQAATATAPKTTTAEKAKADAKAATKDAKKAATDAAAAATSAAGAIECKLKGDTRLLEVRSKDNGCELAYTKAGQENVVASSMNGNAHCETVSGRIKEKLVAAGYTCN